MGQNFGPNPANGSYYPAAIGGTLFSGANQAVVATALAAGLPTTYTGGLVLANTITSAVNLIIQRVTAAFTVVQSNAAVIGLGVGYNATTNLSGTLTAVAVQNANPASAATPSGLLYSSASITLPTAPLLARVIGSVDTGAVTTEVNSAQMTLDIGGSIILPPGGYAVFTSSAAGTASSFLGSFEWVELPAGATV
jgi:hypothetical protein